LRVFCDFFEGGFEDFEGDAEEDFHHAIFLSVS
jgi:hypothetical protein